MTLYMENLSPHLQIMTLRLSKILTAGCLFLVVLSQSSSSYGSAPNCSSLFSVNSNSLKTDRRYPQIPLFRTDGAFMGYEFLEGGPIFKNPNALREYINLNPGPRRTEFETEYLGPNYGQIDFEVGREAALESIGKPERQLSQPTKVEIFKSIKKHVPKNFISELLIYIDKILKDAHQRDHRFHVFTIAIRTEKYPHGFLQGHNHNHAGDLNYAKAEIGANSEIDSKNRFAPESIREEDYISSQDPNTVAVFGVYGIAVH